MIFMEELIMKKSIIRSITKCLVCPKTQAKMKLGRLIIALQKSITQIKEGTPKKYLYIPDKLHSSA